MMLCPSHNDLAMVYLAMKVFLVEVCVAMRMDLLCFLEGIKFKGVVFGGGSRLRMRGADGAGIECFVGEIG